MKSKIIDILEKHFDEPEKIDDFIDEEIDDRSISIDQYINVNPNIEP